MPLKEQPAFANGQPVGTVQLELVDGVMMTLAMKRAWVAMKSAAARDGILLFPTFGFRTMQQQRELYVARMDQEGDSDELKRVKAEIRKRMGVAARPGYSLHQSGRALDVRVGISPAEFAAGKRTKTFEWLDKNAKRFGFATLRVRNEPWHLEFTEQKE